MSGRSVVIKGENGEVAAVETLTGAQLITDLGAAALNAGTAYVASVYEAALAGAADFDILVRAPASKLVYASLVGDVVQDAHIQLFEGTTTSADGTSVSTVARNRHNPQTASTLVFEGPTVTDPGTQLLDALISAGQKQSVMAFGTEDSWILGQSTDYLVRLTNLGGSASAVSLIISLNEYDDPPGVRIA